VGRQLGQELLRVLGAHEDGKARFRLLFLLLRQQRDHAADDGGALVALAGPARVVDQQPVEPALVVGLRQERADKPEKSGLDAGGHVEIDPRLLRQRLGLRLVLVGEIGRCQHAMPDGGPGLGAGKEGLDVARARAGVEQRFLGALGQQAALRPCRIGIQEGANLARRAKSATVEIPVDELAGRRVGDLVPQGLGVLHPAARHCRDRLA
jgi:hypothetical protein